MYYKEIITDHDGNKELYLYFRGKLIYKKWLNTGISILFNSFGLPTWNTEIKK
jgi:hypothetical protein